MEPLIKLDLDVVDLNGNKLNSVIPILIDDTISDIKKKVSMIQTGTQLLYIPYIKLYLHKANQPKVLIKYSESLLNLIGNKPGQDVKLIVTSLIEELSSLNYVPRFERRSFSFCTKNDTLQGKFTGL